jgi:hypothetical protein
MLAYITGTVDQELLPEKRISDSREPDSSCQSSRSIVVVGFGEATLAEIAKRLGRKALADIAAVAKPDTLAQLVSRTDRQEV